MNILVVCQYYYPEPVRISDICETLVTLGHHVTVITGTPNYPMGNIYPGYEAGKLSDEVLNGVRIHRCQIIPRKTGVIYRFLNYISFPVSSKKYIRSLRGNYDVVFVNQLSPVLMARAGIWYKNKYNKRMILYCLDLWPESLCVGGIKKGSLIYKIFKNISKKIYREADEILVTSRSFHIYLQDMFGIEDNKMNYLPQYAEDMFLDIKPKIQTEKFELVFAGNIGTAQNIDTILDAATILKDQNIMFHIVGDGVELERMKEKAHDLAHVLFYGRKPIEEMRQFYEMADAMLVTLTDDPVISLTLPGKVQSYMAAGKAIVGAVNGETPLILAESQGGYCGAAGDGEALAENILKLKDSGNAEKIGMGNRNYYLQTFSKEKFMDELLSTFAVS